MVPPHTPITISKWVIIPSEKAKATLEENFLKSNCKHTRLDDALPDTPAHPPKKAKALATSSTRSSPYPDTELPDPDPEEHSDQPAHSATPNDNGDPKEGSGDVDEMPEDELCTFSEMN
jgi:hypothetical protein